MCNVCQHNQVHHIDRLLLGGADPAAVGKKYGFSPTAVQRHQEHLHRKMAVAAQRFQAGLHQGLFLKLNAVLEMVLSVVRHARGNEDFKLFLQATREVTRLVNLMLKMQGGLEPEMIYSLAASPQWDLQDGLFPDALASLAQTKETLKANLFTPCPEPDPVSDAPPPSPPLASELPATGKAAPPPREMSEKLARKTVRSRKIVKEYKKVNQCKKISPPQRDNLWRRFWQKWEKSGKSAQKNSLSEVINQ